MRTNNTTSCIHEILHTACYSHLFCCGLFCLNYSIVNLVVSLDLNQLIGIISHLRKEVRIILTDSPRFRVVVVYGKIALVGCKHSREIHFFDLATGYVLHEALLFRDRVKAVSVSIITALTVSLDTAFDTANLKSEQAGLESEIAVVSDLIEKCIYENAHVALDQTEYQKRYDELTARFDTAKARYEAIAETIHSKQSRRATIEAFLETLTKVELVDKFETTLWCGLVEFVTVYSKDDVRFTFKNGQEIHCNG